MFGGVNAEVKDEKRKIELFGRSVADLLQLTDSRNCFLSETRKFSRWHRRSQWGLGGAGGLFN